MTPLVQTPFLAQSFVFTSKTPPAHPCLLYTSMGNNARKLAEERFNLEIFSREIAESLQEISNFSSKNRTFA